MILHPVIEALPSWRSLFPSRDNFTTVDAPRLGEVTFHLNKVIPESTFLLHCIDCLCCHLPHHLFHRFPCQRHNSQDDWTWKGGSESSKPGYRWCSIMLHWEISRDWGYWPFPLPPTPVENPSPATVCAFFSGITKTRISLSVTMKHWNAVLLRSDTNAKKICIILVQVWSTTKTYFWAIIFLMILLVLSSVKIDLQKMLSIFLWHERC